MNKIDRFLTEGFPTKPAQFAGICALTAVGMSFSFFLAAVAPFSTWAIPAKLSLLVAGLL